MSGTTVENRRPKVVVVGGGFAGLNVVRALARTPVDVVLLDRTNHHLFQPLLYQVAAAALSPRDIARPLRDILRRQKNTSVLMAEVTGFDVDEQEVLVRDGERIHYDYLVVAIGARHSYFGQDEWEAHAPGLKTLEDALELRRRILLEFERAERLAARRQNRGDATPAMELTFVVVGGGPTGVEMAGAIAEISRTTMQRDFRSIKPENARTVLVEASPRVLFPFPEELSAKAQRQLETLGVEVRTSTRVTELGPSKVVVQSADENAQEVTEELASNCVIWAAGNLVSDILADLPGERDRSGRMMVTQDLSLPSHSEVFVVGDAAHCLGKSGEPLAALAPVAMQQGKTTAANIRRDLRDDARKPFAYWDRGTMATIGKARAVAWFGKLRFGGLLAWLSWSTVHVMFLIGFRSRVVVMFEWLYLYLFGRRDARLIHGWSEGDPVGGGNSAESAESMKEQRRIGGIKD